jgi:hypothetical protein
MGEEAGSSESQAERRRPIRGTLDLEMKEVLILKWRTSRKTPMVVLPSYFRFGFMRRLRVSFI